MNLVSSDKISPELIELLTNTELGTNGARYIHLDTKERIKEADNPVSYITTVGLYGADDELLAVAKLSEPLKKTPENSLILRTRLDF